jgi:hypothetical protein
MICAGGQLALYGLLPFRGPKKNRSLTSPMFLVCTLKKPSLLCMKSEGFYFLQNHLDLKT